MKSKKTLIIIGIVILIVIIGLLFVVFKIDNKESDALKFKSEYEELNNTIRESDKAKYNNVNISSDNPIKYVNIPKALKILDNEDAIIYVGAEWCPWCRNAVPVLFDVAKEYNVDTIYYLKLDDDKSNFEIKDGNLVKTKDGTKDYYKLLNKLKDNLDDYILTDDDGKEYNTNEKRVYMPFVLATKNGKVVSTHVGTVNLDENQTKYDKLTNKQYADLYEIYSNLFDTIYDSDNSNCNSNKCD